MLLPYFGTGQPLQNTGAVAPIRSTDFTKTFIPTAPPPLPPQHSGRVYGKLSTRSLMTMTHMESTLMIYPHGELASSFVSPCHDPMPSWTLTLVLLLTYKGRMDVITDCHVEDIPFGDTEYCEQATKRLFPKIL